MASVDGDSQPSVSSDASDVHPAASSSTTDENALHKTDTEAQPMDGEAADSSLAECPVCLQLCVFPVKLPCSHVFCFLCLKGVAGRNRRCALCRADIPQDFVRRPVLVGKKDTLSISPPAAADEQHLNCDHKFRWYYEGVGGWWEYDERTSVEIENYQNQLEDSTGDSLPASFELLIAGFIYIIDLENHVQYRRGYPTRRRRIKRDLPGIPDCKGVAGLVCRKKVRARRNGDGKEDSAADSGATASSSVQSVQATSSIPQTDNGPSNQLADSAGAVASSHGLSSQSEGQQFDVVTEQLADLELAGGLRRRRRGGNVRDVRDSVLDDDRRSRHANEPAVLRRN